MGRVRAVVMTSCLMETRLVPGGMLEKERRITPWETFNREFVKQVYLFVFANRRVRMYIRRL